MKQQHKSLITIFIVLATILVASWWWLTMAGQGVDQDQQEIQSYVAWQQGDRCFNLDVADTAQLRRQGLSGREGLTQDEGMIFLYRVSGEYGFWMKDMNFSIDMIWLNENDEIVTVRPSVSPDTYPEVFYPTESARKIIEVAAGTTVELNLEVGDRLNLSGPTSTPAVDCLML